MPSTSPVARKLTPQSGQKVPRRRSLTILAKKHGLPDSSYVRCLLKAYDPKVKKSGLTPLTPWFYNDRISPRRVRLRRRIRGTQAYLQGGFDASEMLIAESLAHYADMKPQDLKNPIHPLLTQDKWKSLETLPANRGCEDIGDSTLGQWHAHNPVVWELLKPCLQLASAMITNTHSWAWWDALIFAPRELVKTHKGIEMACFRRRGETMYRERAAVKQAFIELSEYLQWRLMNGNAHVYSWMPNHEGVTHGVTLNDTFEGHLIGIDYHLLIPLLRNDLTTAEILIQRWTIAETIIHETAHAINNCVEMTNGKVGPPCTEPYFEDEALDELGFSAVKAMTTGFLFAISRNRGPAYGSLYRKWPIPANATEYSTSGHVRDNLIETTIDRYPVPVKWFEEICQDTFWTSVVANYGGESLKVAPLTHGRRTTVEFTGKRIRGELIVHPLAPGSQIPITNRMGPAAKDYIRLLNERRFTASRVLITLKEYNKHTLVYKLKVRMAIDKADGGDEVDNAFNAVRNMPDLDTLDRFDELGLAEQDDDGTRPMIDALGEESEDEEEIHKAFVRLDVGTFVEAEFKEDEDKYFSFRSAIMKNFVALGLHLPRGEMAETLLRKMLASLDPPVLISGIDMRWFMTMSNYAQDTFRFGPSGVGSFKVVARLGTTLPKPPPIRLAVSEKIGDRYKIPRNTLIKFDNFMGSYQLFFERDETRDFDSKLVKRLADQVIGWEVDKNEWDWLISRCDALGILWGHGGPGIIVYRGPATLPELLDEERLVDYTPE